MEKNNDATHLLANASLMPDYQKAANFPVKSEKVEGLNDMKITIVSGFVGGKNTSILARRRSFNFASQRRSGGEVLQRKPLGQEGLEKSVLVCTLAASFLSIRKPYCCNLRERVRRSIPSAAAAFIW